MKRQFKHFLLVPVALLFVGCASSPAVEEQRHKAEEDIATILSQPLDPAKYGEPERCLTSAQYRDFSVLDDQRILFEGSRGRLWLNELRMRCPDLRFGHTLVFETQTRSGRICDLDSFEVVEWAYWPRYRRWPWHWFSGVRCTLGKFQPVTEEQVEAIRAAIETTR